MSNKSKGLEGVIAAETRISLVDGANGVLSYGGYAIEDLAENTTFEEVCHLLWYGELPSSAQLDDIRARLSDGLQLDRRVLEVVRLVAPHGHPMASLRTTISALSAFDPDAEDMAPEAADRKAVRLTAQAITLTAAIERVRGGHEPIAPRRDLSLAGNLLYMLRGETPDTLEERIIDAALILHAEHGMNASTFAARVTAGTLADMHSAVVSAIGALKGPSHGGANVRVMEMLREIDESGQDAGEWVRSALERKQRVMGFGHRVYKATDPRATVLRELADKIMQGKEETRWLDLSDQVRAVMAEEMENAGKKIYPNVDFFSASVYRTLGIAPDLFTTIFAIARVSGWTAHLFEQYANNRLIRPKAEYVGPRDLRVEPLEHR
jgi:citrate synthase